jgi:hypothetical protein
VPISYHNIALTRTTAKVFEPANRCIYCPDGSEPFTKEHIIPRGLGGGLILPKASCTVCQEVIKTIETYCMRRPFLPYRLANGLVHNLKELGETLPIKINTRDGRTIFKHFKPSEFPNYLVMPALTNAPGILVKGAPGPFPRFPFWVGGDEKKLRELHALGDAVLIEKFNAPYFFRVLAKIAHAFVAGQVRIENFDPLLPEFVLGKNDSLGSFLIGRWPDDGVPPINGTCQIGLALSDWGTETMVNVRLKLFPSHPQIPAYHIAAGTLTRPVDEVLALLEQQSTPANA